MAKPENDLGKDPVSQLLLRLAATVTGLMFRWRFPHILARRAGGPGRPILKPTQDPSLQTGMHQREGGSRH